MDLQVSTEMSIALGEDGVSMEVVAEEQLYCVCQTPWDVNNRRFMIHCDHCQNWFHGDCVGITEHESQLIDSYSCPRCEKVSGPSKYKDASEAGSRKPNKRYSPEYGRRLKEFCFLPADEVIGHNINGNDLTVDKFVTNGFFRPIIVDKLEGLGLRVPPSTFTIHDVERYLEPERMVDVIDVEKQVECRMPFKEFANYFTDINRKRLLNLISLEVSNSKLGGLVEPPYIARKLDFLTTYWPKEAVVPEGTLAKPAVTKYCLISAKDSYTDFHIDFGGTSVWYHVLWGQKVFYLMEPTKVNLELYNQWLRGDFGNECFLPDEIQQCYRCVLNKGQTLFIPTGWIHAVYTPHDSLVFGGNFLHKLNMGLQLQIHAMERKSAIAAKYLFPNFETTHWYAAEGLRHDLKRYHKRSIPPHILQGSRELAKTLTAWLEEYETKKNAIPVGVDPHSVIRHLKKEIHHAEKYCQKHQLADGSPNIIIRAGLSTDEHSRSSGDGNLGTRSNSPLGSPELRIKMKISRKSLDEWSPATGGGGEPKNEVEKITPKHVGSSALQKLIGTSEDDSKDSFECLYIDETDERDDRFKKISKWDTDSSIVSSESRHSKKSKSRSHKEDKDRKRRRHKNKHKKPDEKHRESRSKNKHKTSKNTDKSQDRSSRDSDGSKKNRNSSLNDALAGALDGMEELIKSSNYTERVSNNMTDAVKESVVGLGSMTDTILSKRSFDGEEASLKQVHQDDDYIYLPLVASDDEKEKRRKKKKRTREDDDETWSPTGKLGNVGPRHSKEPRHHAKRKAIEKGLKEAASRPLKIKRSRLSSTSPLKSFKRESSDSPKKKKVKSQEAQNKPTCSSSAVNGALNTSGVSDQSAMKKWKKGMQTPKQRLSKILKMGKFFNR